MDASLINPLGVVRHTIELERSLQVCKYARIQAVHVIGWVLFPPFNAYDRSHRKIHRTLKIALTVNDRVNEFQADKDATCAFF